MDHDAAFPNPIARTDLPQPRKKWRYVVVGLILLFVLTVIFLPQLIASKVGRNVLKTYIESKYRGKAWVGEMKTGWMGSTTIHGFSLIDPEGRSIRFARLDTDMPLG